MEESSSAELKPQTNIVKGDDQTATVGGSGTGASETHNQLDEYFNLYMEDIQKRVNEYLVIDEFNKLQFYQGDVPALVIDFIDYITGTSGLYVQTLTQNLAGQQSPLHKLKHQNATAQSSSASNYQLNRHDSIAGMTSSHADDDTGS